jgi:hypothetical protein
VAVEVRLDVGALDCHVALCLVPGLLGVTSCLRLLGELGLRPFPPSENPTPHARNDTTATLRGSPLTGNCSTETGRVEEARGARPPPGPYASLRVMLRMVVRRVVRHLKKLPALMARRWLRRSAKPSSTEAPARPAYEERFNGWFQRLHFPPVAFYAELWREPRKDPSFLTLSEKYDEEQAELEVGMMRSHLPDELMTAAVGLLYTLGRIETILAELQVYVDKHVKPLPEDEPWPEFGYGVAHPLVVEASFEFGNFLGWLRTIDERLDRSYLPGSKKSAGLLPELADRPLRARVQALVEEFRGTTERTLANYQLHAGAVVQPLAGAQLNREHIVSLRIPDRPTERVATRLHLSYKEEREALTMAREAAQQSNRSWMT